MPWRGRAVDQGLVVYVAAEGGLGTQKRIAAWLRQHGLEDAAGPFGLLPRAFDLTDTEDVHDLIRITREAAQMAEAAPRLIVVDTLARCLGVGDENSGVDMGKLIAAVDQIRTETGAHVLLVHHSGKDATRGARGHSSLRGARDTLIQVESNGTTKTATVLEQKDLEAGQTFPFALEVVDLGTSPNGDPVTSCVVVDAEAPAKKRGTLTTAQRQAMDALHALMLASPATIHAAGFDGPQKAVPTSEWKAELVGREIVTGANDSAKRQSFKRLKDGLVHRSAVVVRDHHVWPVPPTWCDAASGRDGVTPL